MKKYISLIIAITLVNMVFFGCNKKSTKEEINDQYFLSPPATSDVHTWWHWMDGNITKEGMTKDLEAMKAAGISQATILNIGLFNGRDFGNKRILFDTPEWYEHFEYALKEADRLGIKIGIHNCDGWTTSGGPWIKPEHAMKQFVWNKIIVKGGQKLKINLPEPFQVNNYYRDVKVMAVKSPTESSAYIKANPEILLNDTAEIAYLNDGCPVSIATLKEGDELTIQCGEKIEVEKVAIYPIKKFL